MTPNLLTPAQAKDLKVDFRDHTKFCRDSLQIRDLIGTEVALNLSPGQAKLTEAIDSQRRRKKPVRLVVLKTRRSYFTAGACAEIFHEVAFFPGRRATIIANNYKPAGLEAFDYLMQYELTYKPFERHGVQVPKPKLVKPQQPRSPVAEGSSLQMIWENGSSVDVLSADGGDVGRGGGRHILLLDELAFWRSASVTLTAVLNMVPKDPETAVIVMSTGNGIGGEFYDLVQRARDPLNEGGFEFLFFGWLEHTPYRIALSQETAVKLQTSLDDEEKNLVTMHGAHLEQLAWRRLTIATECRGSVDLFHQEYPTTPEEAFLASGRPVFNPKELARHPACEGTAGELQLDESGPARRLLFIPKDHGALSIWSKPEKGHLYVIGADPSKGIDVSAAKRGANPDYSVGFGVDRMTGIQVSLLRERIRPLAFAEYLAYVGRWYNWAYLVPEANDAGFIDALIQTGYPLELIYQRQRDPTDRRPPQVGEIGFETTGITREWLITAAEDAIRSMAITIKSPVAINECQTFVFKPNGRKEHREDCHDDTVIALALTAIGLRTAPRKPYDSGQFARPNRVVMVGSGRRKRDEDDD